MGGLVDLARSPAEFLERIDRLVAEGKCRPDIARSRSMDEESWDEKVEEMSRIVAGLGRRPANLPVRETVSSSLTPEI